MEYLTPDTYIKFHKPKKKRKKKEKQIRKRKHGVVGVGESCPKCSKDMERRGHLVSPKKTWHYIKWDFCKPCKHVQHYEKFKSPAWVEEERQEQFFNSI